MTSLSTTFSGMLYGAEQRAIGANYCASGPAVAVCSTWGVAILYSSAGTAVIGAQWSSAQRAPAPATVLQESGVCIVRSCTLCFEQKL